MNGLNSTFRAVSRSRKWGQLLHTTNFTVVELSLNASHEGDELEKKFERKVAGTSAWLPSAVGGAALLLATTACIYDSKKTCGKQFVVDEATGLCVCPEGQALTATGCLTCTGNEVATPTACNCKSGYERVIPTDSCTAVDKTTISEGSDADAGLPASLDTVREPLPSDGLGDPCSTPEDCAGKGASWCDTVILNQCIVSGCDVANNNCPANHKCCDLSEFGVQQTLCLIGGCGP